MAPRIVVQPFLLAYETFRILGDFAAEWHSAVRRERAAAAGDAARFDPLQLPIEPGRSDQYDREYSSWV
jgi:hypothetical protein